MKKDAIHPMVAIVPIIVIIISLNILKLDVNIAMLCGVITGYLLFWKNIDNKLDVLTVGVQNSIASIMNTSTAVGIKGVALACSTLADKYRALDVSPIALHKIASCACIVLDTMPWNGVMITTMSACDLTHTESYKHLFIITVVLAFVNLCLCTGLCLIIY